LITHDAALRTLADARARVYARLAHTEPVRRFRSGDLVTRLVSDHRRHAGPARARAHPARGGADHRAGVVAR
jgi:hypothetical protein